MKPMLAFRYDRYPTRMPFPCYGQPKLDGVRLMYRKGIFQTRSARGDVIKTLQPTRLAHLRDALSWLPPHLMLDGEAYIHGVSRQKLNGYVSVNSNLDLPGSRLLQYHIFDCVDARQLDAPFDERHGYLSFVWQHGQESIRFVETVCLLNKQLADEYFYDCKQRGYEGCMYRDPQSPYGFLENCGNQENRWHYIHKRKTRQDAEGEIIGYNLGTGKYIHVLGSLEIRGPNGVDFSAGSGLSDDQREEYSKNPPIGQTVTFEYDILSDDGTPIQPVIKLVHDE